MKASMFLLCAVLYMTTLSYTAASDPEEILPSEDITEYKGLSFGVGTHTRCVSTGMCCTGKHKCCQTHCCYRQLKVHQIPCSVMTNQDENQ